MKKAGTDVNTGKGNHSPDSFSGSTDITTPSEFSVPSEDLIMEDQTQTIKPDANVFT